MLLYDTNYNVKALLPEDTHFGLGQECNENQYYCRIYEQISV